MASSSNDQVDLHTQLWHECAGLTVKVPCVGDKVFYFPQGHLEQVEAYMKQESRSDIPSYGLPSKILCKVVGVQLKAEVGTDEVFAEITLLPDCEEPKGSTFRSVPQKIPARLFRKRLTPSDVSKQGGCSLYKRHVDETFPPLDMSQDTPSQELVAKDLHGKIWNFHHICRGVPTRHLLTTGWGKFVNAKRLLVGDTCIFLRWQNQIYVGVRRAVRLHKWQTDLSCINMQHGILVTALEAINKRTEFTVYYHPRISPLGFIVAHDEFTESLKVNFSPKTRVEMILDEGGEEPEYNLKKLVFRGHNWKKDVDPTSWPRSEWQCLKVRWEAASSGHVPPVRVSPWNIQSLELAVPHQQSLVSVDQNRSMHFKPMIGYHHLGGLQGQGTRQATVFTLPEVNFSSSSCEEESKKCTLFGVDLGYSNTGTHRPDSSKQQSQNYSCVTTTPSYIKVLKHGAFLGRSIEISRFSGYQGLVSELDRMFVFEGTLVSGSTGWLVTYVDGDGSKKLLGDLSWFQFREVVQKMYICPKEEVARWNRSW